MLSLTKDILDMDKIESGMIVLTRSEVDLSELFQQCADSLSWQASAKGITIELEPISTTMMADGDRIAQVLINLLNNAVKFSPENSKIRVLAKQLEDSVEIIVQDQGRGIPANKVASIFDRFAQVEATDATEKHGTGLGLAICKSLVELHGGTIKVESEEGKGSAFSFNIPNHS